MSGNESVYDQFLHFRATVIRSIAQAWRSPEFKKFLLADPKKAMKEQFQYEFPFDFDLHCRDASCKYTPLSNLGWTIYRQDTVKIVLPPKPKKADGTSEREHVLNEAAALAEFNASHITFL